MRPWKIPPIGEILDDFRTETGPTKVSRQMVTLEKALAELGVEARIRKVYKGPTVTQFGLEPGPEVQISKIKNLDNDLALALCAPVAIEEPGPGHPYVRIVVADEYRTQVKLRRILESSVFQQKEGLLKVGLGLDTFGEPVVIDLTALPHLLIGGATGSGKSVCINGMIAGLLCTYSPDWVQFLMIDPAQVELKHYEGIPHLFAPVVVESEQVVEALHAMNQEINRRYTEFSKRGVRDLLSYNQSAIHLDRAAFPYLVIIIDNLADLMIDAPGEVEPALTRIAAMGRGAGIHLIFATQRSNVELVAGALKANLAGRIAFKVVSSIDSRLILDSSGAENLFGPGDLLYKGPDIPIPERVQGVYVSDQELDRIVRFWQRQQG